MHTPLSSPLKFNQLIHSQVYTCKCGGKSHNLIVTDQYFLQRSVRHPKLQTVAPKQTNLRGNVLPAYILLNTAIHSTIHYVLTVIQLHYTVVQH